MLRTNHYQILGVLPSALPDEIKRAYRKIAMANHPDRKPDDVRAAEKFQAAKESYEILLDPKKREEYDKVVLNRLVDNPTETSSFVWVAFIDQTLATFLNKEH